MSNLSDAQEELKFDLERVNARMNFAKVLLIKYQDIDAKVPIYELDKIWEEEVLSRGKEKE